MLVMGDGKNGGPVEPNIPHEVMEAARRHVAGERATLQAKISNQRRQIRLLNQAHQSCFLKQVDLYRLLGEANDRCREQSAMCSRTMGELAEAKGWNLQARHYNACRLAKP